MTGKNMTVAQVLEEVEKDIVFYDESGGGATISGGEPFMQPIFLHDLLQLCGERKIHTAVETCGLTRSDTLLEIGSYVDLFLYDLKVIDASIHEKFTGVSNSVILENLEMLSKHHARVIVRFPLVPGVNDDEGNLSQTAGFVSSLANVEEIQILPYHRGAVEKYRGLGRTYELLEVKPPSKEEICHAAESFARHQLKVRIGG
jgi:pyruvate formate lyase activating enzyme